MSPQFARDTPDAMHVLSLGACSDLGPFARALAAVPGLCWLDGASSHADGGWSFLAAAPVERVMVDGSHPAPLAAFDERLANPPVHLHPARPAPDPPQAGPPPSAVPRWIGYVAYDAWHAGRPTRLVRDPTRPVLSFARYDALVALDHHCGIAYIVGDDEPSCVRLRARLGAPPPPLQAPHLGALCVTPAEQHRAAIARALEHIADGDIYQVNLARRWEATFEGSPLALWARLRAASPVPFGFYYDDTAPDGSAGPPLPSVVMARTMERYLRFRADTGQLLSRPIKGTLARHGDHDCEEALALQADPKEHAEHAMIVDLMRNDLGRVAALGSVRVAEVMGVEAFAGLSHMVSTIECYTRPDVGLREILEAAFPPGSVTGTPKLRAIEVIEQLEAAPRGVYTGAVGFVDRCGGLSLAVAIRTAVLHAGLLSYFAGGGIVEASDPDREIAETELKARVLLDALHSGVVLG